MFGLQNTRTRETKKQISPGNDISQCAQIGRLCEGGFGGVHVHLAAFINQSVNVAQPDIFAFHAHFDQHVQAGNTGCTAACGHDLDVFELLARDVKGIFGGSTDDNGRAMLIVVENRDIHALAADTLNHETIRGLDVFQIDCPKRWLQRAHDICQLFRVCFIHLNVKAINGREFLEQNSLAFHHRL